MKPAYRKTQRPVPGIHWGDYPERDDSRRRAGAGPLLQGFFPAAARVALQRRVTAVQAQVPNWRALSDPAFLARRASVEAALARKAMDAAGVDVAAAFVADAARRVLGLAAYDCQLFAALAILDNRLVEMATGQGKSLAAALAAAVGALAGIPVHVLTANDYLVERDAAQFRPFYEFLGLSAGCVLGGQPAGARRTAYAQPVVYVTAKELVFDYLRDRLLNGARHGALRRRAGSLAAPSGERPLLRGLCMAIVDEADSILIDEASMPLVLSRPVDGAAQRALYWQAHALAGRLVEGDDFLCRPGEHRVELTPAGRAHVERLTANLQPAWKNQQHRDETIASALSARHVFRRDRDYLVTDGEVHIIDAVTGRTAPERKWSRGLHALVSLKENCRIEPELETLAQITFQRFFRRYVRFGGMSGTLAEARGELRRIYGVPVVQAALHRPNRRERWATRFFIDDATRWDVAIARVRGLRAAGRPVLIGCDSVAASRALARHLEDAGIAHDVLDARMDRAEAEIIGRAGTGGQVTVATHMAGRGTDIHIDAKALAAGGLHVILCQHNPSRRHDRQLAGRAGRQGQPGSSESLVSLESPRFAADAWSRAAAWCCTRLARDGAVALPGTLLTWLLEGGQHIDEASQARRRRALLASDEAFERGLAFCEFRE
jgi:preprotein translocase subunit SecA